LVDDLLALDGMGKWWCVAHRLQPGYPRLGSPIRWVAGSRRDRRDAVPRRDPVTACRSLGGHDLAVTAVTADRDR
jgi:hypothetical protein